MSGTLTLVATPIGNLGDISLRAIEVLKSADLIACEDTRHSGRLLKRYEISGKLLSLHDHNESARTVQILQALIEEEKNVALISDAGTPLINDPGWRLVQTAIQQGVTVTSVPGPSALVTALTLSGLPADRFVFEGFLPVKSGARRKRLEFLAQEQRTVICYESPHRLVKSLRDIREVCGNVALCCARELTKKFEECIRGSVDEVISAFEKRPPKGEFVLLFNRDFNYEKQ